MAAGSEDLQRNLRCAHDYYIQEEDTPLELLTDDELLVPVGKQLNSPHFSDEEQAIDCMEYDAEKNWKSEMKRDYILYKKADIWSQTCGEFSGSQVKNSPDN